MIYIAMRFGEFSYGLGALVSLIHDVLMTVGLFCLWPWPHRTFSMPGGRRGADVDRLFDQ